MKTMRKITQLKIAETFVPSSDEDDIPIVQTMRAEVCPPHKHIPKSERAVGQPVAKQFESGLFVGKEDGACTISYTRTETVKTWMTLSTKTLCSCT
jgi:hypothetical protein